MGKGLDPMLCAQQIAEVSKVVPPYSVIVCYYLSTFGEPLDGTASRASVAPMQSNEQTLWLRIHGHIQARSKTLPFVLHRHAGSGSISLGSSHGDAVQAPICVIFRCVRSGSRRTST